MSGVWRSPHVTGRSVLVSTSVSSVKLEIQGLILLDKVTKKTLVDLQKRFPIYPANSKYLAGDCCGLAVLLDHDQVEVTLVDWERGTVHCVLTRHP